MTARSISGGGRGSLGMGPISQYPAPPVHHKNVDFVAMAKDLVAAAARDALDHNSSLSAKQKQKLQDVVRKRYDVKLIAMLLEAMAESANPLAFADILKGVTLDAVASTVHPSLCVVDSYLTNTRAQKDCDIAQAQFLVERTTTRRDQLLDALGPEETTLHFHKLSVLSWNPTNRRTFT